MESNVGIELQCTSAIKQTHTCLAHGTMDEFFTNTYDWLQYHNGIKTNYKNYYYFVCISNEFSGFFYIFLFLGLETKMQ